MHLSWPEFEFVQNCTPNPRHPLPHHHNQSVALIHVKLKQQHERQHLNLARLAKSIQDNPRKQKYL